MVVVAVAVAVAVAIAAAAVIVVYSNLKRKTAVQSKLKLNDSRWRNLIDPPRIRSGTAPKLALESPQESCDWSFLESLRILEEFWDPCTETTGTESRKCSTAFGVCVVKPETGSVPKESQKNRKESGNFQETKYLQKYSNMVGNNPTGNPEKCSDVPPISKITKSLSKNLVSNRILRDIFGILDSLILENHQKCTGIDSRISYSALKSLYKLWHLRESWRISSYWISESAPKRKKWCWNRPRNIPK